MIDTQKSDTERAYHVSYSYGSSKGFGFGELTTISRTGIRPEDIDQFKNEVKAQLKSRGEYVNAANIVILGWNEFDNANK